MDFSVAMITILIISTLILLLGIFIYNNLINKRNRVQEGWSDIDVQLIRRHDLIPNLLAAVKGYMSYEKDLIEKVTELRARAEHTHSLTERAETESLLSGALSKIFAVAENYPDLKANQNFLDLQKNLSSLEENIQLSRRYYNGAARDLNIAIETFPSNFVAQIFHFEKVPFFMVESASEREVSKINF